MKGWDSIDRKHAEGIAGDVGCDVRRVSRSIWRRDDVHVHGNSACLVWKPFVADWNSGGFLIQEGHF